MPGTRSGQERENRMIAPARARTVGGALLGVFAAFALSASVALGAPTGAPGNNGTIKVHDDREPSPDIKNQPHVDCPFHFHFFFADAGQTGDWWVMTWPPTGPQVFSGLAGSYTTNANGEYVTGDLTLDAGHYKLYWEGRNSQNVKHKAFWVDTSCQQAVEESPPEGGPAAGGEPTPFNGAIADSAPAPTNGGTNALELAVLLGGGSALALVVLRPVGRGIRRR